MLSCRQLTESATDYLEKNLPWRVRLTVPMHLWICRQCRRYLEQMRKVITFLQQLPKEPVPPGLAEKLLPQLRKARDRHTWFLSSDLHVTNPHNPRLYGGHAEWRLHQDPDVARYNDADLHVDCVLAHQTRHLVFPSVADQHHRIEESFAAYVESIACVEACLQH